MFIQLTKKNPAFRNYNKICFNVNNITYITPSNHSQYGMCTEIGYVGTESKCWYVAETHEEIMAMIYNLCRQQNNTTPSKTENRLSNIFSKTA